MPYFNLLYLTIYFYYKLHTTEIKQKEKRRFLGHRFNVKSQKGKRLSTYAKLS